MPNTDADALHCPDNWHYPSLRWRQGFPRRGTDDVRAVHCGTLYLVYTPFVFRKLEILLLLVAYSKCLYDYTLRKTHSAFVVTMVFLRPVVSLHLAFTPTRFHATTPTFFLAVSSFPSFPSWQIVGRPEYGSKELPVCRFFQAPQQKIRNLVWGYAPCPFEHVAPLECFRDFSATRGC